MPELELEEYKRRTPMRVVDEPTETRLETDTRSLIEGLRSELDGYYKLAAGWAQAEPDQVLMQISAISARLTEVRAHLNRDNGQRASRLRISEIDPFLEQLEFQFKVHSRLQAIRELDYRMSGGQV